MTDNFDAQELAELAPGVRRLVAPNPGMMTGPGTNTYLLGRQEIAVIDPGPAIPDHVQRIVAVAGAPIRWILVTHTHTDHSPAAASLAAATGASRLGRAAPDGVHQDAGFEPERTLEDGDCLVGPDFELEAVHTPGHASNHLCYFLRELGWLFTGDHIINGSTVVIDPPDGSMSDYLRALRRLKDYPLNALAPGHGPVFDRPLAAIDALIKHRLRREDKVLRGLRAHPGLGLSELVAHVYDEVDSSLHRLAERSLLAHLQKLQEDGIARVDRERWWPVDQVSGS